MPLVALKALSFAVGAPALLDNVEFELESRERVCLVGRNGEGKTTLLRLIAGEIQPDDGVVQRGSETVVATLPQTFPSAMPTTVWELVAEGLGEIGTVLQKLRTASDPERMPLEAELNRLEGWDGERKIERWCDASGISPALNTSALSGGQLRRALMARALVAEPDVLILDEPTNHLDLPSIQWLETLLDNFGGAVLFTTHDRAFLRRVATRILELDRGSVTSWPGNYENYLRRREERQNAEEKANERLQKFLSEEERWIRQGIKARRTRNEGRVRRLYALREEQRQLRSKQGAAKFGVQEGERSSRRVIEAQNVSFGFDDEMLIRDLSTIVQRGDKVGIVGPNGTGKTTLIKLLLGDLTPSSGDITQGTRLDVAYFDQRREQLDDDARVVDCVADGTDHVEINGESRHVISYLQDFLFTPERVRGPVRVLSGGERNRLLLAKLFAKPANLLVLDEPTNDLDVETLELLEERLAQFGGTLLVVSHDREFLDNVVTNILVFEGNGRVIDYAGGYSDYAERQAQAAPPKSGAKSNSERSANASKANKTPESKKKLSYKETRELAALPEEIESLETEIERLQQALADPKLYQDHPDKVTEHTDALRDAESTLEARYERWAELDEGAA